MERHGGVMVRQPMTRFEPFKTAMVAITFRKAEDAKLRAEYCTHVQTFFAALKHIYELYPGIIRDGDPFCATWIKQPLMRPQVRRERFFEQPLRIMAPLLILRLQVDLASISQLLSLFLVLEERLLHCLWRVGRGI